VGYGWPYVYCRFCSGSAVLTFSSFRFRWRNNTDKLAAVATFLHVERCGDKLCFLWVANAVYDNVIWRSASPSVTWYRKVARSGYYQLGRYGKLKIDVLYSVPVGSNKSFLASDTRRSLQLRCRYLAHILRSTTVKTVQRLFSLLKFHVGRVY